MSEIRADKLHNASGDNDSGIDLSTNDQVVIKTADTTAVTVDSSQNVAFSGNISVDNKVQGASGESLTIESQSGGAVIINTNGTNERVRITSGGTTDIQTSSASHVLKVTHPENADKNLCTFKHEYAQGSQTATMIQFLNSVGNERGSIKTDGTNTAFNTSSDYRLKENIEYNWDATTRLKQLKPCRFNWIEDETNRLVDGFLAHEVSSIVPQATTGEKDATETYTDDDGNKQTRIKPQGIDQSKLVPLLVKTIQELEARITALESK